MGKSQKNEGMIGKWFSPNVDDGTGSKTRLGHLLAPRKKMDLRDNANSAPLRLYRWQKEALEKWAENGYQGIVEAVTGSGKTCFAIAAIADLAHVRKGYRDFHPLIVVPTKVLMNQWADTLEQVIPEIRVGKIDGSHKNTFADCDICVGVINSVLKCLDSLFAHTNNNPKSRTLLVADECHRYIRGPVFSQLRDYKFHFTLAISATVFTAAESHFVQGFGPIIYEYGFEQGGKDGLVPPFDLVNCEVEFTLTEKHEYSKLTFQIKSLYRKLIRAFPEFLNDREAIFTYPVEDRQNESDSGDDDDHSQENDIPTSAGAMIRKLRILYFLRVAVYYKAKNKLDLTTNLVIQMLKRGNKILIYFERIQSAENARDLALEASQRIIRPIRKLGYWCKAYHSEMSDRNRQKVLDEFDQPGPKALFSCRSLDEGLDVPEVDCAILAASTQSIRQRVQRIGRVLRRGEGGKKSLIVTLYVSDTGDAKASEDDYSTFGGPVHIHQTNAAACDDLVCGLLEEI